MLPSKPFDPLSDPLQVENLCNEALHALRTGGPHVICEVTIDVQGERCRGMAEIALQGFDVISGPDAVNGVGMPLRYNNDKPEKPRNFKGLEVYQADFSSFSNPKNQATKPLFRRGC